MAYIIAQPAKDPEPYKPPVLNDDRQKEIDEQRKRVLKWKKRKREGTRPDEPGPPHNGQEPRWRDEYFVWGSEVGKDTLYWDEITGNWMNRDLFVESQSTILPQKLIH